MDQKSLVDRYFTKPGQIMQDVFAAIRWTRRDAVISGAKGVVFEQKDVEAPEFWSDQAVNIVAEKYFRGPMYTPQRETSVKQLIARVVVQYANWGLEDKYFATDEESEAFAAELAYILVHQIASFNSPVWFNVGIPAEWRGHRRPQASACFILSVEDHLEGENGILDWFVKEGKIFKEGSGSGANLSKLRSSHEFLSAGGRPSGPISFMKTADANAGQIKSGGKNRRAAKLICLDADHGDIEEFIWCKAKEERRAHKMIDAGIASANFTDPEGAYALINFQNANNSVRTSDQFLEAVEQDGDFWTLTRKGEPLQKYKARQLFRAMAEAAHICGDPGMQYDDTINHWNPVLDIERINSSNPCCFPGEMLVDTSEGRIRFDTLEAMSKLPYAFSFDRKTGMPALKRIKKVWVAGYTRNLVEVLTDKGIALRCTPEHRFLTYNGEYIQAKDLTAGTRLRKVARSINENRSSRRYINHKATPEAPNGSSYQSVWMWQQVFGSVPEGFQVHHRNEDPTDDRISNFELRDRLEHMSFHSKGSNNARFLAVTDEDLLSAWEAIESTPKITWTSVGQKVTPSRWNSYIRKHQLQGKIPFAQSPAFGGNIQGMSWDGFAAKMTTLQTLANDRVLSVSFIALDTPVPVYDLEVEDTHNFAVTNETDTSRHTIVVSNSEYMHVDNSACNLASINLLKFLTVDQTFNIEAFRYAIDTLLLAMEISVGNSGYPTALIEKNSHELRPLGLGYANLGALLLTLGLPYDSDEGRAVAASITSLLGGYAYYRSAHIAERMGPFSRFPETRNSFLRVIQQHLQASTKLLTEEHPSVPLSSFARPIAQSGILSWRDAYSLGSRVGYRNAQVSLLAPTGTISFMMGCETTGVEPYTGLLLYKSMVGGGYMQITYQQIAVALQNLGYSPEQVAAIELFISTQGHIVGAPHLQEKHYPVFDTAFGQGRTIAPMGHVKMMAAVQPFLSGATSKTCNLPETATVEEIEEIYLQGWKLGLKAIAIYRDGCKRSQPLSTKKQELPSKLNANQETTGAELAALPSQPVQRKMPKDRPSLTHKFRVGAVKVYLTMGFYEDGTLGEIFIDVSKEGSTISGLFDIIAKETSFGLQYGVPLEKFVDSFKYTSFEPCGMTDSEYDDLRFVKSIPDYIFRYLEKRFITKTIPPPALVPSVCTPPEKTSAITATVTCSDAPPCSNCGSMMVRKGSCYGCVTCGETSGCS